MNYLFLLVTLVLSPYSVSGLIDGLYCGRENCYKVLGVERDVPKSQIAKVYRQLAKKYHPDVHKTEEAKIEAAKTFTLIAAAYEVLKDEDSRKDYDDLLDNPDTVLPHYYRYYRRRIGPKVDARVVIAVFITIVSIVQAIEIAKEENLMPVNKKRDKRTKEEIKEEAEVILKKIVEERIDIKGGYSKPSISNILWIQLFFLPFRIAKYISWNIRWWWKFNVHHNQYGREEKKYLIKRNLGFNETQWETIPESDKEELFEKKVFLKRNFDAWLEERRRKAASERIYTTNKRSKR